MTSQLLDPSQGIFARHVRSLTDPKSVARHIFAVDGLYKSASGVHSRLPAFRANRSNQC